MFSCWILLTILPLLSVAIAFCGKSRETAHTKSDKSIKLKKNGDKTKNGKSVEKSGKLAKTGSKGKSSKSKKVDNSASLKKDSVLQVAKPCQGSQPNQAKPIEVRAEPQEINFKSTGGIQSVNVVNNSGERRVFKVKCSDNQLYRIHPVYCVIEAGQTGKIEVLRNNGTSKMDKLILLSVKASDVPSDLKNCFSKNETVEQHMMAVALIVDA